MRFTGTTQLDGADHVTFVRAVFDAGTTPDAALFLYGQGAAGATHDVRVESSALRGGGRTVFVLGRFAPAEQWNHHLVFAGNELACGSRVCFQISGGRDLVIESNRITATSGAGVLTAGATRVQIVRNRFTNPSGDGGSAMQLATPGREWDNYAGVENMISSQITVANNLVVGWGEAVRLDAAREVAIAHNTAPDHTGVLLNQRAPHDQAGNVILAGNEAVRVWNNVLGAIATSGGAARPMFESNNLVRMGGAGAGLLTQDPRFVDTTEYELAADSPAVDSALVAPDNPAVDFDGRARDARPDRGVLERNGVVPARCP